MTVTPEIECSQCDGNGFVGTTGAGCVIIPCAACNGQGWRAMTPDEIDDAAADAFSDMYEGEPPITMQEQHAAAWQQKQELRHG